MWKLQIVSSVIHAFACVWCVSSHEGKLELNVGCLPQSLSTLFLRQALSLNLELTGLAKLAGQ